PALRVMLEGTNRQEILFIGDPVAANPPAGGKPADQAEYYAQLEGRNVVFTVMIPTKLMDTLRNAQESLREKRFLEFDAGAVTKIELPSPMQPPLPPVTLQRLESAAGQSNAPSAWQVVRRGEGAQGPQTVPADRTAVQHLLEQLSLLSANKFKS